MWVEFGNKHAVEHYRDPNGENPDEVLTRPFEPDTITLVQFPEGLSLQEAFTEATIAWRLHTETMEDGGDPTPAWIESDSPGLEALLKENYGLKANSSRPKTFAKEIGADESLAALRETLPPRTHAGPASADAPASADKEA